MWDRVVDRLDAWQRAPWTMLVLFVIMACVVGGAVILSL